jgi:hypothetical protein
MGHHSVAYQRFERRWPNRSPYNRREKRLLGFGAAVVIDVGLAGLDTSHSAAFANALTDADNARLTAVWDGGTVRDEAYVEEFCVEHTATAYEDPTGMVSEVDAAMVLSVDWERHRSLAIPFLDAGVPTCIDKPVAGCIADLDAMAAAAGDTALFGGSAVPYHPAFADIPTDRPSRQLYCVGYNDLFYYGVHLADTVRCLAGVDWTTVESGDRPGELELAFENECRARLFLDGPNTGAAFGLLDASDRVRTALADSDAGSYAAMYRRYLAAFLAAVRGENSPRDPLNGARLLLAMEAAREHDQRITPDSDALAAVDVKSAEFVAEYSPYY